MALALALLSVACTQQQEEAINTEQDYVTVELSVENAQTDEEARAVSFSEENGKPRFQFGFTSRTRVAGSRLPTYIYYVRVHTTITKEGSDPSQRVVIFEGDLDWKRESDQRRLTYKGPLKILSSDWQNLKNVQLHAVVGEMSFSKAGAGEVQAKLLSLNGNPYSPTLEVPYAMTTEVVQVKGKKILTLAEPETAKFYPQGVLTVFTIKNNLSQDMNLPWVYLETSGYSHAISVDKYGKVSASTPQRNTPMRTDTEAITKYTLQKNKVARLVTWLPKEDVPNITRVTAIGNYQQGDFTPASGTAQDGKLMNYEVVFSEKKFTLDKGQILTDSHGNVVPRVSTTNGRAVAEYSASEVKQLTNSNDLWHLSYYVPIAMSRYAAEYFPGDRTVEEASWESVITPGLNESNYFRNSSNTDGNIAQEGLNDLVKFTRSGSLQQARSKFRYVKGNGGGTLPTIYSARFINFPEYRVLQRWQTKSQVASGFTNTPLSDLYSNEVSFLPYDEVAVNDGTALTEAYWEARKNQIQTIKFRSGFANANIGPVMSNMAILGSFGIAAGYWSDVMNNFVRAFRDTGTEYRDVFKDLMGWDPELYLWPIISFKD